MVKRLHHIGVAAEDFEAAVGFYRRMLGQEVVKEAILPEQGLRLAAIPCGPDGVWLEVISPVSPESPLAGFLAKRGEGLHHIALEVDDIERALPYYEAMGCEPLARRPEPGLGGLRTLFFHPRTTRRVLVELVDRVGLA